MEFDYEPDCSVCRHLDRLDTRMMSEILDFYTRGSNNRLPVLMAKRYLRRLSRHKWLTLMLNHVHTKY
jgi:hypothetical protein